MKGSHRVVGYARDPNPDLASVANVNVVTTVDDLIEKLEPPRVVWVMVPAGNPTEAVITDLSNRLGNGDIIIDGGNSFYKDTAAPRRSAGRKGTSASSMSAPAAESGDAPKATA